MPPLLLMLLQTEPAPVAIGDYADFDLAKVHAAERACGEPGAEGEIVVCAHKAEAVQVTRDFSEKPVRAGVGLGGGWTGSVHGIQHAAGIGVSVPAAMVTVTLKF